MLRKIQTGFTVVEVLIVIALIAVLTAIIYPSVSEIRAKNRDATRIADISNLQLSLYKHYSQNGFYPEDISDLVSEYLSTVPTDPKTGEQYYYVEMKKISDHSTSPKCVFYHLGTVLELENSQVDLGEHFNSSGDTVYEPCHDDDEGFNGNAEYDGKMYDVHP